MGTNKCLSLAFRPGPPQDAQGTICDLSLSSSQPHFLPVNAKLIFVDQRVQTQENLEVLWKCACYLLSAHNGQKVNEFQSWKGF